MIRVKKPIRSIALLFVALAVLASCASKPKELPPEPAPAVKPAPVEQPAPPPAPTVSQEDLDKLLADAKSLKKKAFDLKLFEVLPDDYKAADALLATAQKSYDAKDQENAKKQLEAAVAAYQELVAKGVVAIASAKQKEAEDMKAIAVKAGADSSQPERFGSGDTAFKSAADLVAASKHEESIPGFEQARLYYELAWKRDNATKLRQGIADKDYAKWDSGNFQLADTKYQAEEGLWASGNDTDRSAGADALDEAILRYNLVIQKGREMTAATAKAKTDESKKRSEDIKADVAVKELYEAALEEYNSGTSAFTAKDYENATDSYGKSGSAFDEAYQAAAEKRAKAEAAIKAAEEATAESQRVAEEADPLLQPESSGN